MYKRHTKRVRCWIPGLVLLAAMTAGHASASIGSGEPLAREGGLLGSLGAGLQDTLGHLSGGTNRLLGHLRGRYLEPTPGTVSFETAVSHQGLGRRVIYIRPEQEPEEEAPALVMLHYGAGTSERMASLTRAAQLAKQYGVWVILPEAVHRRWAESPFSLNVNDDAGFISAVIDDAVDAHPVDASRIYLAGFSNGGFMANRFACAYPEQIAGAAVVATTLRRQRVKRCDDDTPVPMLIIDGTDDPVVPYDGRFGLLSAPETFDYWAQRNGCAADSRTRSDLPAPVDDGTQVEQIENMDCGADSGVRLLTVVNGGHRWPGGDPTVTLRRLGAGTENLDATQQAWMFLREFVRN